MDLLLKTISKCTICKEYLPLGPRPVVSASPSSKIVIIGQAPGTAVHNSGIPWDDKSGDRLRSWLGVTKEQFYNPGVFGIMPMGFCYPGKGKSGDLPPRKECAPEWHKKLFSHMKDVQLTLLIGSYANDYYLGEKKKRTLTDTVKNFREYLPEFLVLPHPSPRNNIWLKRNLWFEKEVIPIMKEIVMAYI